MSLVPLPPPLITFLDPYLPQNRPDRPFVTLTWAQSLDARIAAAPGTQTKISHPETKTMTHYLRAHHDAILVGVGTVLADDPKLTCRYGNFSKIRPVVVDPNCRWEYSKSTIACLCEEHTALAPIILISDDVVPPSEENALLLKHGGLYRAVSLDASPDHNWATILAQIHACGLASVMIEGGARVINSMLPLCDLVDSVIVTVGPVFLGENGVGVAPSALVSLTDVSWWTGQRDSVMAARLLDPETSEEQETKTNLAG